MCGKNFAEGFFSNQCEAGVAHFSEDECTCYEGDNLRTLLEDKFGHSNCDYRDTGIDDYSLFECRNDARGNPAASLYFNVIETPQGDVIEMPDTLFFAASGGSNTDMMFFNNNCRDVRSAVTFLNKNGM